jgi:predicted dehydrogenase
VSRLRIAVVGAGMFGRRHIDTVRREALAELAAVADPAVDVPGTQVFRLHDEMLEKARPDGVIVATPNALHVPVALACIERGIPVLVEKPLADTVAAGRRLAQAAKRASVPVLVGHHRRHNPRIERARELVRGGGLGRLAAVSALWLLQKPDDYFDTRWRREPGGGPLLINFIHDVDDLRFICGEITEVRAMTAAAIRKSGVEDSAAVAFRFACGALGTATVSDAVPAPWSWELSSGENPVYPRERENCYFFSGTAASLALPAMELWSYKGKAGWHAPLTKDTIAVNDEDPQARQLRHFCRVIRGEEAPRIDAEDALRTLAAVEAVHQAAASGEPVPLS